jgi:hypothetical protein
VQAQASGNIRVVAMVVALGQADARGDGIIIAGVIATWGGKCALSIGVAVAEAAAGEAEEARMTLARRMMTLQTWPPGGTGRHYMWREEQIKQFAYLIRSGEGKWWWVMNDYKVKDIHNAMTAAAVADGNKDDGKNNSGVHIDRWTSSAWSNFMVRILFLNLLLLA